VEIEFALNKPIARLGALALVAGACAVLTTSAVAGFVTGALSDRRVSVTDADLEAAAHYFPSSGRIKARLAETEVTGPERDLAKAEETALSAIDLSPNSFGLWMVLAAIKEARGDRPEAERALRLAGSLAPANGDVQWRLANLMLRQGKTEESLDSFRTAINANRSLLPVALDLVWRYSKGSPEELGRIVPGDPRCQVPLARFLLRQSRSGQALDVFESIDPNAARLCPESWEFLNDLIASNAPGPARSVWLTLTGNQGDPDASNAISNAGFEQDSLQGLDQFDWKLTPSDSARVYIDPQTFHSGQRSLRIEFAGNDTTRLDGTIKQLTAVEPGAHYRLEYYWRTEDLVTTEGPRIALTSSAFPQWSVRTDAVAGGTNGWQQQVLDFVAPGTKGSPPVAMTIGFVRIPKLQYEAPMRGTVWLDDFELSEVH
jgi:tetratricopeptide (TPR) repeat protein